MQGVLFGTICVCVLRFLAHFLSGFIVWGSITNDGVGAILYSLTYNGSFMSVETVITVIVIGILYKSAPKLFKAMA